MTTFTYQLVQEQSGKDVVMTTGSYSHCEQWAIGNVIGDPKDEGFRIELMPEKVS